MHEICAHSRKSQAQVVGLEGAHEVRNVAGVVLTYTLICVTLCVEVAVWRQISLSTTS